MDPTPLTTTSKTVAEVVEHEEEAKTPEEA
jgi:hypothetical protein